MFKFLIVYKKGVFYKVENVKLLHFFKRSQAITFGFLDFFLFFFGSSLFNVVNQIILKQEFSFRCTPVVASQINDLSQIIAALSPDHSETCGNILETFLKMH